MFQHKKRGDAIKEKRPSILYSQLSLLLSPFLFTLFKSAVCMVSLRPSLCFYPFRFFWKNNEFEQSLVVPIDLLPFVGVCAIRRLINKSKAITLRKLQYYMQRTKIFALNICRIKHIAKAICALHLTSCHHIVVGKLKMGSKHIFPNPIDIDIALYGRGDR